MLETDGKAMLPQWLVSPVEPVCQAWSQVALKCLLPSHALVLHIATKECLKRLSGKRHTAPGFGRFVWFSCRLGTNMHLNLMCTNAACPHMAGDPGQGCAFAVNRHLGDPRQDVHEAELTLPRWLANGVQINTFDSSSVNGFVCDHLSSPFCSHHNRRFRKSGVEVIV